MRINRFVSAIITVSMVLATTPAFAATATPSLTGLAVVQSALPSISQPVSYWSGSKSSLAANIPLTNLLKSSTSVKMSPTISNSTAGLLYGQVWFTEPVVKDATGAEKKPNITPTAIKNYLSKSNGSYSWSTSASAWNIVLTPYYQNKWITAVYVINDSKNTLIPGKGITDYAIVQYRMNNVINHGSLAISISPLSPSAKTVYSNNKDIEVIDFNVTASPVEDVKLDTLTITELITNNNPSYKLSTFDTARLYSGATLLGQATGTNFKYNPGATSKEYFNFSNLNYVIGAGQTKTIRMIVNVPDYGPTSNPIFSTDNHQFAILEDSTLATPSVQATGAGSAAAITVGNGSVTGVTTNVTTTTKSNIFTIAL